MNEPWTGWPVIAVPEGETLIGRSRQCQVVISDASLSRRHARVTRQANRVELEDLDSRFGTFVNTSRIRHRPLERGDIVRFGNSPPYRFDGQELVPDLSRNGLSVSFEEVGIQGDQGQWLLRAASVAIAPGEFAGVLGPSGAGKSLLLECLGTLRMPDAGTVRFDGDQQLEGSLEIFRSHLGQVPQDDQVYPWLTVQENLQQAAAIRLAGRPRAERLERVDEVLGHVGLVVHREKRATKLSGGQRKRLSVAVELLREPRLLLLDEPTSGLDPGLQGRLMDLLRRLARRGMTVVCSTHTLDTVNYFDRVIVVGKDEGVGTVAWGGSPDRLLPSFGVRHAWDLYDRLQNLEQPQGDSAAARDDHERGDLGKTKREPASGSSRSEATKLGSVVMTTPAVDREHRRLQAETIAWRSLLGFQRDRMSLVMSLLQPLVLATLVVLSQYNRGEDIYVHFFLIVSSLWMGMTLSVREIVRERPLYQRDRMAGLHPDAYLFGRTAALLVPLGVQVVLLYAIAQGWVSLWLDESTRQIVREDLLGTSWFRAVTVLGAAGVGGLFIGLFLSILAGTERAAVAMLPMAILPQFLLSRVASGHAGAGWAAANPFSPIIHLSRYFHSEEVSQAGLMLTLGSLPLISRPATGALAIPRQEGNELLGEWLYLLLLLLLHALIVYTLFRFREGCLEKR